MKDYSFGNFICALRVGRGLSQYQLGALVGVTDKAVSKWENGDSKPRISTCQRLAAVLGVTVSDLLSCGCQNDSTARKDACNVNKVLWEKAHSRLRELYGAVPPMECWGRLESEQTVLSSTDVIVSFDLLGKLRTEAYAQKNPIIVRGAVGSSFAAWLLGATSVNPLPPHYRCEKCKRTEFHPEVKSGWDLPKTTCVCGGNMVRDGHDIPFEGYANSLQKYGSVEISMAETFGHVAERMIRQHYQEVGPVVSVEVLEEQENNAEIKRYMVLSNGEEVPRLNEKGVMEIQSQDFYRKYRKNVQYTILFSEVSERLRDLAQKTDRCPEIPELIDSKIIHAVYEKKKQEIPNIAAGIDPVGEIINFSLLVHMDGLYHGTCVWEGNGDELVLSGVAKFRELPAFREDVWKAVLSKIKQGGSAGFGFPLKVMEDVRLGRYERNGMGMDVEQLLLQLGIQRWYIEHLKKICYLFPKAHCISFLENDLRMAWYEKNTTLT